MSRRDGRANENGEKKFTRKYPRMFLFILFYFILFLFIYVGLLFKCPLRGERRLKKALTLLTLQERKKAKRFSSTDHNPTAATSGAFFPFAYSWDKKKWIECLTRIYLVCGATPFESLMCTYCTTLAQTLIRKRDYSSLSSSLSPYLFSMWARFFFKPLNNSSNKSTKQPFVFILQTKCLRQIKNNHKKG